MKIDLSISEVWDLLHEGSTNQRNFINSLRYSEFQEFIEIIEDYNDFDLRGHLNSGVLAAETNEETEENEETYIIYRNDRVTIYLY